jgi:aspartate carbamoyltransferase catalytic subunit
MIRGLEISSEVADGPQSVIAEQVRNGVAIRMALIHRALVEQTPHTREPAAGRPVKQPGTKKRGRA